MLERDRDTLSELAETARERWGDPNVTAPRDRWVNVEDDQSIVDWMYEHEVM